MKRAIILAISLFFLLASSAYAELFNRGTDNEGNQLIYDDNLNITWYDYTNSAQWPEAWQYQDDWASELVVTYGGTQYTEWRLPSAFNQNGSGPCYQFNCTGSEMGNLFYTSLGNTAGSAISMTGEFLNLESTYYWVGTEIDADNAWMFRLDSGFQGYGHIPSFAFSGIAVLDGDVPIVPEPISSTLFLIGGSVLGFRGFRKQPITN